MVKEGNTNTGGEGECRRIGASGRNGSVEGKLVERDPSRNNQPPCCNSGETQDEMVRRINEELAEFRQQLKKSQELFHALVSTWPIL